MVIDATEGWKLKWSLRRMAATSKPPRSWRIAHTEISLGWGGQERRILAELKGFRDRGSQVFLWTPPDARLGRFAADEGISVVPLSASRLGMPFTIFRMASWLRTRQIQILNPHSSRDAWIAGIAGRLARTPFIIRSRHFDVAIPHPWMSRPVYVGLSDHIITTSPSIAQNLRQIFQLPESRVTTLPTGIDLTRFTPEGTQASFTFTPEPSTEPLIGMIGVFRHAKGHRVLLEAAKALDREGFRARYVLVGSGPGLEKIQTMANEMNLGDRFFFSGEREDIPEILRGLDLVVMPSLHEGIPQVGLQALACKTPLIGSDIGGLSAILGKSERGRVVPPGDPAALARAIRESLTDLARTQAMSQRGREFVEAECGLETMMDRLDQLYSTHFER